MSQIRINCPTSAAIDILRPGIACSQGLRSAGALQEVLKLCQGADVRLLDESWSSWPPPAALRCWWCWCFFLDGTIDFPSRWSHGLPWLAIGLIGIFPMVFIHQKNGERPSAGDLLPRRSSPTCLQLLGRLGTRTLRCEKKKGVFPSSVAVFFSLGKGSDTGKSSLILLILFQIP